MTSLRAFASGVSIDYAKQSRNKFPFPKIYVLKDTRSQSIFFNQSTFLLTELMLMPIT